MSKLVSPEEYEVLDQAAAEYLKTGKITLKCPRCGSPLIYEESQSTDTIRCEKVTCIRSIRRGI